MKNIGYCGMVLLLINLLFHYTYELKAQTPRLIFSHLGEKAKLQKEPVWTIYQDKLGFIWIGTFYKGLFRYDGNDFIQYTYSEQDTSGINDNSIGCIYEDTKGNFWIGTRFKGLNLFVRETNRFYHFIHDSLDSKSLSHNQVHDIIEDNLGNIWVGTRNGLDRFKYTGNPTTKINFEHFFYNENDTVSLCSNDILGFFIDSKKCLWIGTSCGLNIYNPELNSFKRVIYEKDRTIFSSFNEISSIKEDNKGLIWIGTGGGGLISINPKTNQSKRYIKSLENDIALQTNMINSIAIDRKNNLWLGTNEKGLIHFDQKTGVFTSYINNKNNPNSISHDAVFVVYISRDNNLWTGNYRAGLNMVDFEHNKFERYISDGSHGSLSSNNIQAILKRRNGEILLRTKGSGIHIFNKETRTFTNLTHEPGNNNTIAGNAVSSLFEDSNNRVWVGTSGAGITVLNSDLKSVCKQFPYKPELKNSLISRNTEGIIEDPFGNIWTGTDDGLSVYNIRTGNIKYISSMPYFSELIIYDSLHLIAGNKTGIYQINLRDYSVSTFPLNTKTYTNTGPFAYVNQFMKDSKGNLWVLLKKGVQRYFPDRDTLITYAKPASTITEDRKGRLWFFGNEITMFNPSDSSFKTFNLADGIPDETKEGAILDDDGYILVGGVTGLIRFHPDSLDSPVFLSKVVLTNFYLANVPSLVNAGKRSEKKFITYADKIELAYKQNIFSIEFSALKYTNQASCKYAYKLDGFDNEWIYTTNDKRIATYTNLSPGHYTFMVKQIREDRHLSSEITSIDIHVLPPWWLSWWAYVIYSIALISLLYYLRRYDLKRIKIKHELSAKSFETQKLHELDNLKSRFFANISHELRTPLTLIVGYLSNIINRSEIEASIKEMLKISINNAQKLKFLINQILDMSKLDEGKLELRLVKEDIIQFLKPRVNSFSSLAESKGIELHIYFHAQRSEILFDPDKVETVVNNLLSNAFKFTNCGGNIWFETSSNEDCLIIKVKDSGIGIPNEIQDKIFERYFQVFSDETAMNTGSGLGLSLTKDLVELHHGSIEYNSKLGIGIEFIIKLPLAESIYKNNIIVESKLTPLLGETIIISENKTIKTDTKSINQPGSLILIVEDNTELRNFLCMDLHGKNNSNRILEAVNGRDGYELAKKEIPDIIISDWMMPVMNGIEFCEKIKENFGTSHIPVIMLTAKADLESKLNSLEKGADAYLTKPFETTELHATIENLLHQRAKLKEKFSRNILE